MNSTSDSTLKRRVQVGLSHVHGLMTFHGCSDACAKILQIDYEKEQEWERKVRTTWTDWRISLETIIQWSPYSTEAELIQEVYLMLFDHLMAVDVAIFATILVFPYSSRSIYTYC